MSEVPQNPEEIVNEERVIEISLAPMETLTPYKEEFFIDHIEEGQVVAIGRGLDHARALCIQCDFSAFEETLKEVNPEKLEERFVAVKKLLKELPGIDEQTRRLIHACWKATRLTRSLLGDISRLDHERIDNFSKYKAQTNEGAYVAVKPLSSCKDLAMCAEYALLTHHVLAKLGINSSVVIGAFSDNPENVLAEHHSYLVLEGGKYVFDPTHTATQKESWPPKFFTPETPLTLESLQNMETGDFTSSGRKIVCTDVITQEEKVYGSGAT